MVILVTFDKEQFVVDKEVAERSALIKKMLEDAGENDQPLSLPQVCSTVLRKVLEYCEHYREEPLPAADESDISEWDQKFLTSIDLEVFFGIILAANYLDIKPLLDVGCKAVTNMTQGKTPEEIRRLFNIVSEPTPEEEMKENECRETSSEGASL